MGFISASIILIVCASYYHTRERNQENFQNLDKKEHPLKCLYRISSCYYEHIKPYMKKKDERLRQQIRKLDVITKTEVEQKLYVFRCKQISFILLCVCLGSLFTLMLSFQSEQKGNTIQLERNGIGRGEKETELFIKNKKTDKKEDYILTIQERAYTKKEWDTKKEEVFSYIEKHMKGKNTSLDEVCTDLYFPKKVLRSGMNITYKTDNRSLILEDGTVNSSKASPKGELVSIVVTLQYQNFLEERVYTVRVIPQQKTKEEQEYDEVIQAIREEEEKERSNPIVMIPKKVLGYEIQTLDRNMQTMVVFFVFSIGIGVLLFYREEDRMKEQLKQRKANLMKEYPEFIHQLVLFIGAGMTLKATLQRIGENYNKRKEKTKKHCYLYEELLAALYELEAGIAEEEVYRNFANRIGTPAYKRIIELLIQGLKKGAKNTIFMLEQEERSSLEMKKELAKRLGEEAGTKLLMPMIVLFFVILLLVLYPAFVQFQLY